MLVALDYIVMGGGVLIAAFLIVNMTRDLLKQFNDKNR